MLSPAPVFAVLNEDVGAAEVLSEELVRAARSLGQPSGLAFAHLARGFVLSYAKDHEAALASLTESIELTRAGASDAVYPYALAMIAREQLLTGQVRPALASVQLALAHGYRVGFMGATASAVAHLVWVFGELGLDEDAAVFAGATFSGIFQMAFVDPPCVAAAAAVRERLGEARYEEASARGAVMGYDEVVTLAMDSSDRILSDEG